jgi:hypothetical protein
MNEKKRGANPIIALMLILVFWTTFLFSNWDTLFGDSPTTPVAPNTTPSLINTQSLPNTPSTTTTKSESVGVEMGKIAELLVKYLIVKLGFLVALGIISPTVLFLTMFFLAKLGIGGKYAVRGGIVVASVAAYYVGSFQPMSLFIITPISLLLILAGFGFSFGYSEKARSTADGESEQSKKISAKFDP